MAIISLYEGIVEYSMPNLNDRLISDDNADDQRGHLLLLSAASDIFGVAKYP